ncbi:MAG: aminotransferase class I/II-fold pyridoxal phosphate-dependent enzyme [Endomicrobia bacterium]|nr:aminotransferase class I/II-fold pyridoxal phosphate-dependent enzyme [Endomicrobiia bacterium]MCL2507357.1 aminotransferase class I/II-fold pyridoxal phosphate-dependent enzyme [Endomicrobiia bacterium]
MSADIFEKCFNFHGAEELRKVDLYPYFHRVESQQGPEIMIDGNKKVVVCSNNYLGLANHPKVIEASCEAAKKYGTSCTGSRLLNGTNDLHEKVEKKFAKLVGKEAAILFTTGHHSNLGALSCLVGRGEVYITDKLDHASIIDGCRLSFGGEMARFRHNDMADLERVLKKHEGKGMLVVVDGIFSMEGDIAKLPEIIELSKKYKARLYVDEAHSLGVIGKDGSGTGPYFNMQNDVDVVMATASKSLASIGGFIASNKEVIDYVKHAARSMIFTASLPPACVGAIDAAMDIMIAEPERRTKVMANANKMKKELQAMGYNTNHSESPIIPLTVGADIIAFKMWKMLFDEGVFTSPVVTPAVPEGQAIIRTSYMATHTDEHLDFILDKFSKVGKALGVI